MNIGTRAPGLGSKSKYLTFWGPRLGSEAALSKWRGIVALLIALLLPIVWVPCVVYGFHEHVVIFAAIGVVGLAATVLGTVYGQILLSVANRSASATLGIKIGGRNGSYPPATPKLYETWCLRRGLRPYGAMREDAEEDSGGVS
jgi:hypothetical protein